MKYLAVIFILSFCRESIAQSYNEFTTNFGYIRLGPSSADLCEIDTDKPAFQFQKNLQLLSGELSSAGLSDLNLVTNGIPRMTIIGNSGRIGIGTSSPVKMLHVQGDARFDDDLFVNHNSQSDWNYALRVNVNRDYTKAFSIERDQSTIFTVWGNGVVVSKKVYSEEIEVRPDALDFFWPDYVFKSDYSLMNLLDLENFIVKHNHLPDVPSEKVIKEEGINVAEMDAVLLRKIEELTLYVIELRKEIDQLKN